MEKIAVVTDSCSGISQETAKSLGIWVIPMIFYVEGKEYREGVSLTEEVFFSLLKAGKEVSTSQLPVTDITDLWNELLKEYDTVLHIPMTRGLSGSYEMAVMLSLDYNDKVLVVDGRQISATQEAMVRRAKRLVDEGKDARQIKAILEEDSLDASIYITVDTLEYLRKGGRISGAGAVAGELLKIRPVLTIQGGPVEAYGKARGRKKAKRMMEKVLMEDFKRLSEKHGEDNIRLYVGHADALEETLEWKKELEEIFKGKSFTMIKLPMNICCHVGPGTVGVAVTRG